MTGSLPPPCSICSQLADREVASQKFGWEAYDTHLPAAFSRLVIVKDFRPWDSRKLQLLQCPECLAYYLYRSDYEYQVNGTEDEEILTRLSAQEAQQYRDQPAPSDTGSHPGM